ncbi:MAG TPA: response regulator [Planctomycetota bacterium]|nr:response regulator [Planctomycetota bacterium]
MNTKTRILVVDDDPDILGLLESILRTQGYEVTGASSGPSALALLRGGLTPCLILVDLEMPQMSGAELKQELAQDESLKDIPVVVTSASREHLDRLHLSIQRLGKPFSLSQLIEIVREHCSPVTKDIGR